MSNSQFWTWVDYWEGWDFMSADLEDELELEEWCDEVDWMICMICGSPVEGCICEDVTPTPPPLPRAFSTPSTATFFSELEELTRIDRIAHNHGN